PVEPCEGVPPVPTGALEAEALNRHLDEDSSRAPIPSPSSREGLANATVEGTDRGAHLPTRPRSRRTRERTRSPRRGHTREHQKRERALRLRAARVGADVVAAGGHWNTVARLLCVSARALRRWCRGPALVPLGRPVRRAERSAREAVIRTLDELGPH